MNMHVINKLTAILGKYIYLFSQHLRKLKYSIYHRYRNIVGILASRTCMCNYTIRMRSVLQLGIFFFNNENNCEPIISVSKNIKQMLGYLQYVILYTN